MYNFPLGESKFDKLLSSYTHPESSYILEKFDTKIIFIQQTIANMFYFAVLDFDPLFSEGQAKKKITFDAWENSFIPEKFVGFRV